MSFDYTKCVFFTPLPVVPRSKISMAPPAAQNNAREAAWFLLAYIVLLIHDFVTESENFSTVLLLAGVQNTLINGIGEKRHAKSYNADQNSGD